MSAIVATSPDRGATSALRWVVCFALVFGSHVGVALFVLLHGFRPIELPAGTPPPDAVMLDLAPDVAAPSTPSPPTEPPSPAPEPPAQSPPDPAPEPPPVLSQPVPPAPLPAPIPPPEAAVPLPPEPSPPPPLPRPAAKPVEHSPVRPALKRVAPHPDVVRTVKPDRIATPPARASAPAPPVPASTPAPGVVAGWRSALIQKLQQAKRYPDAARARDEQGVATVQFTMQRDGHILSVNLIHTSGSETLDREAVAMFRRAEPLPALPDGLGTNTLTLTVPVTFSLR